MKYILIIGAKDAGKSTTFNEIYKVLNPTKTFILKFNNNLQKYTFDEIDSLQIIYNGTYIIEFEGRLILIIAGSPTEQVINVTTIFKICTELKMPIDLALIAMRTFEKKLDFQTKKELEILGKAVLIEKIFRIDNSEFRKTDTWRSRIDTILKVLKENM